MNGTHACSEAAARGAERYGLVLAGEAAIHDAPEGDGAVYRATSPDGRPAVLKVMAARPEGVAGLRARARFARYLADAGARVARPLDSTAGEVVEVVSAEGIGYAVTAYEWAPGRPPDARNPAEWNEALFRHWGEVVGRIHALTRRYEEGYPPVPDASPPSPIMSWPEEHASFCRECRDGEVLARWRELADELDALPRPRDAYGLIHNDLHAHNLLLSEGAVTVIDVDVAIYFWFVSDIAVALHSTLAFSPPADGAARREAALGFLRPYLAGYRSANDLDAHWLQRLPLFLRYRDGLLYIVFRQAWGKRAGPWQERWLRDARGRILAARPIVELDWASL